MTNNARKTPPEVATLQKVQPAPKILKFLSKTTNFKQKQELTIHLFNDDKPEVQPEPLQRLSTKK